MMVALWWLRNSIECYSNNCSVPTTCSKSFLAFHLLNPNPEYCSMSVTRKSALIQICQKWPQALFSNPVNLMIGQFSVGTSKQWQCCLAIAIPSHFGIVGNEVANSQTRGAHGNDEPTIFLRRFVEAGRLLRGIKRSCHPNKRVSAPIHQLSTQWHLMISRHPTSWSAVQCRLCVGQACSNIRLRQQRLPQLWCSRRSWASCATLPRPRCEPWHYFRGFPRRLGVFISRYTNLFFLGVTEEPVGHRLRTFLPIAWR